MTVSSQVPAETDTARIFVGGTYREAAQTIPVIDAATGEVFADGPNATTSEIDDAVAAAHEDPALRWASAAPAERAEVLKRYASALRSRGEDTARMVCRENGMPITLSRAVNGIFPAALVGYYAKLIKAWSLRKPVQLWLGTPWCGASRSA